MRYTMKREKECSRESAMGDSQEEYCTLRSAAGERYTLLYCLESAMGHMKSDSHLSSETSSLHRVRCETRGATQVVPYETRTWEQRVPRARHRAAPTQLLVPVLHAHPSVIRSHSRTHS